MRARGEVSKRKRQGGRKGKEKKKGKGEGKKEEGEGQGKGGGMTLEAHYYGYRYNFVTSQWYKLDDDVLEEVQINIVLEDAKDKTYMLHYICCG